MIVIKQSRTTTASHDMDRVELYHLSHLHIRMLHPFRSCMLVPAL